MYISSRRRAPKPIDHYKVEIKLREILCMNITVPMTKAARIVGVDRRTLYKKFQEICNAISKRYTEYQRAKIEEGRQRLKEEITEACLRLREQRLHPSNRRIAQYLGKPGYRNRREVSAIARTFR
jgi:arginine utilization protein RocB